VLASNTPWGESHVVRQNKHGNTAGRQRPPSATRVARSDSQPCITYLDNVRRTYIYVARD
jgi:hypothetical protein